MLLLFGFAALLHIQSSQPPNSAKGTFDDSKSSASEPFHSVGVRGTIDAGGYAASANAKAESEFYIQLAGLQVTLLRNVWAPPNPCGRTSASLRPAITLLTRGNFAAAVDWLEARLRADTDPATRQLLGLAYEGAGKLEAATEQFRLASTAAPNDSGSGAAYAVALLFEGDLGSAVSVARNASQHSGPLSPLVRLCLAAALFQKGQVRESFDVFWEAAKQGISSREPFGFIAIAVRSADPSTLTQAIDTLTYMVRVSPNNGSIHYALACAMAAADGGAPDKVMASAIVAQLKQAIALDPKLADAHFRLASLYAAREDASSAMAEYQSALEQDPRLIEAHYRLGQLYSRAGLARQAKEQLELHQQLRARQKREIESGEVPVRLSNVSLSSCL